MDKMPLHDILKNIINEFVFDDEKHCYFQPPTNTQLNYPCIVYNHTNDLGIFADNILYQNYRRYSVTIIDRNPDSKIPYKLVESFSYCGSDRNFSVDGLHHFVYDLYFKGPRIKEEKENG